MTAKIKYISAMLIFGSVGLFVRLIPLPAAQIALLRGIVGCLFLLVAMFVFHKKIDRHHIRADFWLLLASGAAIGINWIFLFGSYRHTSIANATICYYMAPVIVVFLSPFILKEKLSKQKIICIAAAVAGIVLMAGSGGVGGSDAVGILYGLLAAFFYAAVIIINKFLRRVSDLERSLGQLFFAALTLLPFVLLTTTAGEAAMMDGVAVALLLTLGIVHTGGAYFLYFSALRSLKGQTAALLSYIDPLTAILLSALILHERMGLLQIVGGALILGGALGVERERGGGRVVQGKT